MLSLSSEIRYAVSYGVQSLFAFGIRSSIRSLERQHGPRDRSYRGAGGALRRDLKRLHSLLHAEHRSDVRLRLEDLLGPLNAELNSFLLYCEVPSTDILISFSVSVFPLGFGKEHYDVIR